MAVRTRDRIFALFFAGLFLVTSSAMTVAIVVDKMSRDKKADASQTASKTQGDKDMLQGTILQGFTPVSDVSELQKIDTVEGTGAEVQPGATVTVDYTGAVAATGVIFQSSLDTGNPVSFPLSGVIKGWTDGVPGMKEGGTRRLVIPAEQAYGANPPGGSGIPANAPLVFDITLRSIDN